MKYTPLHVHSHFSLLDGISKPKDIVQRCKDLGYNSCAITDHGSISGSIDFFKHAKKANIKPILGCEFYLSNQPATLKNKDNNKLEHLVVLAKNKTGWKNLISAVSRSNDEDVYYYKPRLDLDLLSNYSDGLICFSGHPGSQLAACLFEGRQPESYLDASKALKSNYYEVAVTLAKQYKDIFGENFFIEIQLVDNINMSSKNLVADILRKVAKELNIKCVATCDAHYLKQEDSIDQQILLCSSLKTTIRDIKKRITSNQEVAMSGFFKSNEYHIPDQNFMLAKHINFEEEVANTEYISSLVEDFDIIGKPKLPHFVTPNGISESEYLKQLCRDGWKEKLSCKLNKEDIEIYKNRVLKELDVFDEAGLAGYFLIVSDYVNWAKKQGYLLGPGRGSAGGCLTSYLLGITGIDPIPYNLLFERFYNSGRNTKDHISYPDIDVDFPVEAREHVINYLKEKYGKDNVCQLITFGRLQGRSAFKEVTRALEMCSNETTNEITKNIPSEAEIADKLEETKEDSIIKWTLEYEPNRLEKWAKIDDKGNINGEFAEAFKQAIRLEGIYKSSSKHAAGVVISSEDLNNVCPMVKDKSSSSKIAGIEMEDLESMGHIKFDILGVSSLSKLQLVQKLLRGSV